MIIWGALRNNLQRLQRCSNSAGSKTQSSQAELVLKIGPVIVAALVIKPEANQGYLPPLDNLALPNPGARGYPPRVSGFLFDQSTA